MTGHEGTVVLRPTVRRGLFGGTFMAGATVLLLVPARSGPGGGFALLRTAEVAVGWLLLVVLMAYQQLATRTELTPTVLRTTGLRGRDVPWGDVQAVVLDHAIRKPSGIRVWTAARTSFLLPCPTYRDVSSAELERHLHLVGQWWLDHRGPDWRPLPPPHWPTPAGPTAPAPRRLGRRRVLRDAPP